MTIAGKTGSLALAAAVAFGAFSFAAPTDASAQWRGHNYRGGAPAYRGAWGGGYRGGWQGGPRYGHRRGWGPGAAAAGVIGGLALGAIAAGAMTPAYPAPVYGPGYGVYQGGYCELRRQRYWDGWGWNVRRVRVCY